MGANAPATLGDKDPVWVCPNCGHLGWPARFTRGSLLVELLLWLFFILPDVIYLAWRLTTRFRGCASCSQPGVVGAPTSRAAAGAAVPPARREGAGGRAPWPADTEEGGRWQLANG
jgi:hypothetical protein